MHRLMDNNRGYCASSQTEKIGFVRTMLMLMVVLYHSCVFWTEKWFILPVEIDNKSLDVFSIWLNTFHVHAFTLVSGYLFSYLKWDKGKYKDFKLFISNKAKRLLVPYVFISVVWAIPIGQVFYHYSIGEILNQYALGTAPSQLWFLLMLFWCFIGAWLLSNAIEKSNIRPILIAIGSFGIGFVGGLIFPNYFCIWTAFQYFPLFVLGMKLRHWNRLEQIPVLVYVALDVVLFVAWNITQGHESIILKLVTVGVGFALHVVGALMAWSVLQWIGSRVRWQENKVFMALSKSSMPMYLFHQQIIYFMIYWLNGKVNPYIHAGINFIVALVCSFIISSVLMHWKVTRFLIGEKA